MKFHKALDYALRLQDDISIMIDPKEPDRFVLVREFDVVRRVSRLGWVVVTKISMSQIVTGRKE